MKTIVAVMFTISLAMISINMPADVNNIENELPSSNLEQEQYSDLETVNKYLEDTYKEVLDSKKSYKNTPVRVTFKSTEGPSEIAVDIYIKSEDEDEYTYHDVKVLKVSESGVFVLPKGDYKFKINAKSMDKRGNVKLIISAN